MKKALTPLALACVLCTGLSVNWLKSEQPRKAGHHFSAQENAITEAAHRHKHHQPSHWSAMVLNQR